MSFNFNYSFGQKNNWRRWLWNRITERCEAPKEALVLFLCGKDALDIRVAKDRGFRPENMIAIERNKAATLALRAAGILTINGTLEKTISTWPRNKPVGVVVGDFCSDIPKSLIDAMGLPVNCNPSFRNSVFAFNFQRGRGRPDMEQWRRGAERRLTTGTFNPLHRGAQLFVNLNLRELLDDPDTPELRLDNALKWLRPAFSSYCSTNGNYFDSTVFVSRTKVLPPDWFELTDELRDIFGRGTEQRRRTAAVMAHHTMRHGGRT